MAADLQQSYAELERKVEERTAELRKRWSSRPRPPRCCGVINASPGDLTPVFDAILEKAHSLCGADHGHLTIYDGETFRAVASHNVPAALSEKLRQPFRPGRDFADRMLAGERVIHIPDLAALPHDPGDEIARDGIEFAHVRTLRSCRYAATTASSATSQCTARMSGRFRKSRSPCSKTSPPRPSSRWRTRGC